VIILTAMTVKVKTMPRQPSLLYFGRPKTVEATRAPGPALPRRETYRALAGCLSQAREPTPIPASPESRAPMSPPWRRCPCPLWPPHVARTRCRESPSPTPHHLPPLVVSSCTCHRATCHADRGDALLDCPPSQRTSMAPGGHAEPLWPLTKHLHKP